MRLLYFVGLFLSLGACSSIDDRPIPGKPAHHTQNGFRNLYIEDPQKNLFSFLKVKWFGDTVWADHEELADQIETRMVDLDKIQMPSKDGLQITWLGHSTFLLQKDGVNILTDPIFGDRSFAVSFMGPKRYVRHVVDYEKLPKIDYVIISHNHYDHLDHVAVKALGNGPQYLVPLKIKDWFLDQGIDGARVREFDWGDQASFEGLKVKALSSQHWSARGLFDRRKTLWVSWALDVAEMKIWFAGDTGYNPQQFKKIGENDGPFDLALIPIGAYEPRDFMKTYHVNPEEAVRLHLDVKAKKSIGMHWGTFGLTAEEPIAPARELARQRQNYGVSPEVFSTMVLGETRVVQ